jgi:hypothetical protein
MAESKSLGTAKASSYQNNLAKGSHDSVIHLQRTICNQEARRMLVRSTAGLLFANSPKASGEVASIFFKKNRSAFLHMDHELLHS